MIKEPAYFVDDIESSELTPWSKYENSIFVKSINEFDDFKLKCVANGKPKPTVNWYLKYINGTSLRTLIHCYKLLKFEIKLKIFQ